MVTFFIILIVLVSALLALVVLIQNPKGGGLSGNIAGFSNQFMGVQQTTNILEKGTWIFAGIIGLLCLTSSFFIGSAKKSNPNNILNNINTTAPAKQQPIKAPIVAPSPKDK